MFGSTPTDSRLGHDTENTGTTARSTLAIGALALVVAIGGLALFAGSATAAHDGDPIVVNATDDSDATYASIQDAIDHAGTGDTVHVRSGTYSEALTVDVDGLTLCSSSDGESCNGERNETIVHVLGKFSPAITIDADNVRVEGMFVNVPGTGTGIDASSASQPTLVDNRVEVGTPEGEFGQQAALQPQLRDYWLDEFVVDTFTGDTLDTIREDRADDEGFIAAEPRIEPNDHVALLYEGQAPQAAHDYAQQAEDPSIEIYENQGPLEPLMDENTPEIPEENILSASQAHEQLKYEGQVAPGASMEMGGSGCTANWIWTTADQGEAITASDEVYLGTAGHCVSEGPYDNTADDGFEPEPLLPIRVCIKACDFVDENNGTIGTGQGAAEWVTIAEDPEDIHFARGFTENPTSTSTTDPGDDIALIDIPEPLYDMVDPSMMAWGGVEGSTETQLGDVAVQYGYGLGLGATFATQPRAGVFDTTPSSATIGYYGAIAPGDSGSAAATGTVQDGQLQGSKAAGLMTHASVGITQPARGTSIPGVIEDVDEWATRDVFDDDDPVRVVSETEQLPDTSDVIDEAPDTPSIDDATDVSSVDQLEIEVSWTPATTGGPTESFNVYRTSPSQSGYTQIASVGSTTTSYVDDGGLTEGTEYCYKVEATNAAGTSDRSARACATPIEPSLPAPSFARAGDRETGGEVSVIWGPPETDVAFDHYRIERTNLSNDATTTFTAEPSERSLVDDKLQDGTMYAYSVQLVDGSATGDAATDEATPTLDDATTWTQNDRTADGQAATAAQGQILVPEIQDTAEVSGPVGASPYVADLDGDDSNEIVVVEEMTDKDATTNIVAHAYEFTAAGFSEEWTTTIPKPSSETNDGHANAAIGDVTGDGTPEIALFTTHQQDAEGAFVDNGEVVVLEANGTILGRASGDIGLVGELTPRLTDVTDAGGEEIVVATGISGGPTRLLAFDYDGSSVSQVQSAAIQTGGYSRAGPVVYKAADGQTRVALGAGSAVVTCDTDFNCEQVASESDPVVGISAGHGQVSPNPTIYAHDQFGTFAAIDAATGDRQAVEQPSTNSSWVNPAVADLDADGFEDDVGTVYTEFVDDTDNLGHVTATDLDQAHTYNEHARLDRVPATGDSASVPGGPVVADVDGDGVSEVLLVDAEGSLLALSPALDDDTFTVDWQLDLGESVRAGLSVADVDGDDEIEVLAGTEAGTVAVIDNVVDEPTVSAGIDVTDTVDATVEDSSVAIYTESGAAYGVAASAGPSKADLTDNELTGSFDVAEPGPDEEGSFATIHQIGLRLGSGATDVTAKHNDVADWHNIGIYLPGGVHDGNALLDNHVVNDRNHGILLEGPAGAADDASLEVRGNTIEENGFSALRFGVEDTSNFEVRDNTLAPTNQFAVTIQDRVTEGTIDVRANDWSVYERDLIEQRIDDAGTGNTVQTVPFQLADGSVEPGLVRIQGEAPTHLSVDAALDATETGDTVLVPASHDVITPNARNTSIDVDTADVTVCGSLTGSAACTNEIEAGHQQLSRAEWADAPGLGSGESVLFDAAGTSDHRSTSAFPANGTQLDAIDRFRFDYYLAEGHCQALNAPGPGDDGLYAQISVDWTPNNATDSRDGLITIRPDLADDCRIDDWFHIDLMDEDVRWAYNGTTGSYEDVKAQLAGQGYEVYATNVVQTDAQTVGHVDNRVVGDVVLGERQDVHCSGFGEAPDDTACRQDTAIERTVLDANGVSSQTATLSASGTTLADVTVENTDRPSDDRGTVLLEADDTALTGARVIGNLAEDDGTVYGQQIGVEVRGADEFEVRDNTIEDWSNMGVFVPNAQTGSGVIADNGIADNTNHAIYVGGDAPTTTIEVLDNEIGLHDDSALRIAPGDRDLVVRDNDLANAKNNPVRIHENWDADPVDLRGNYWGVVRELAIKERVNDDRDDGRVLVVPYLDAAGDQHPPAPEVQCFADGTLTPVDETIGFQEAADVGLPDRCEDRDDNGNVHRTIVLGADEEAYNGAEITTEATVLSGTRETQQVAETDATARIEANNNQPAVEIRGDVADTEIQSLYVQAEPVGATGILVEDVTDASSVEIEDVNVGSRDHPASNGLVVRDSSDVSLTASTVASGDAPIKLVRSTDATVEDTRVLMRSPEGTGSTGLLAADGEGTEIVDNTVIGNQGDASTAVDVQRTSNALVEDNVIADAATGLSLAESTDANVRDNAFVSPSVDLFGEPVVAVSLDEGSGHQVDENTIQNVDTGVRIDATTDVSADLNRVNLTTTGFLVENLAEDEPDADVELAINNATLKTTAAPLNLDASTANLTVDAECNDWGAYTNSTVNGRVTDDGENNTVDAQPFTSANPEDSDVSCLTPPEADYSYEPDSPVTRLDELNFTDESEAGSYPISDRSWDFDDGDTASGTAPTHSFDEVGEFFVELTVTDEVGMSSSTVERITVENIEPVLDPIDAQEVVHTTDMDFTATASDEEGDDLSFDATFESASPANPVQVTEDGDQADIAWNPEPDEYGTYTLVVTVDDGYDTVTEEVPVRVTNEEPTFDTLPDSVGGATTREIQFDVAASDPDPEDSVTLTADGVDDLPGSPTFEAADGEGTFTWTPPAGETGTYTLTFQADSPARTTSDTVDINVREENQPPDLSVQDLKATPGTTVEVQASASDPDNSTFDWGIATDLPGDTDLTTNGDEASLFWTIPESLSTDQDVTFTVDDGLGTVEGTGTVTLQIPPEIDPLATFEVATDSPRLEPVEGSDVKLPFWVVDDDETLTAADIDVKVRGPGLPANTQTPDSEPVADQYSVTLDEPSAGMYEMTVWANDTQGHEVSQSKTFRVQTNDAPEITDIAGSKVVQAGENVTLTAQARDIEERGLTDSDYTWTVPTADGSTRTATGPTVNVADLPAGEYTFEITVDDPVLGSDGEPTTTDTITVKVDDTIAATGELDAQTRDESTYTVSPTGTVLEQIEGWVNVTDDRQAPVDGATVNGTVTYYGANQTSASAETATFSNTTNANGVYKFAYDQDVFGAAPGESAPSVVSAPGWHEITVDVESDSRAGAPVQDTETDSLTIRYFVEPAVPPETPSALPVDAMMAGLDAEAACFYGDEGGQDAASATVTPAGPTLTAPDAETAVAALSACANALTDGSLPAGGSFAFVQATAGNEALVVTADSVPASQAATEGEPGATTLEGEGACNYDGEGGEDAAHVGTEGASPPTIDEIAAALTACGSAATDGSLPGPSSYARFGATVAGGAVTVSVDTVPLTNAAT